MKSEKGNRGREEVKLKKKNGWNGRNWREKIEEENKMRERESID